MGEVSDASCKHIRGQVGGNDGNNEGINGSGGRVYEHSVTICGGMYGTELQGVRGLG